MRRDLFVNNDSDGLSLLSSSVLEAVIDDQRENDGQFVATHQAVLASLCGDDSFVARVVVDEPLTAIEEAEWIAHYRWALDVPCGRLLVCGGFDPEVLGGFHESGAHESVAVTEVPPGRYLVDAYTYLHSTNGRTLREQEWNEKIGRWFRADHPGRPFPAWVAGELALFNDEDPGHEESWSDVGAAVASGAVAVETEPLDWVAFLFRLRAFDPAAELTPPGEGGWFAPEQGLRRPGRFPLGVPASGVEDPVYREALESLLGEG